MSKTTERLVAVTNELEDIVAHFEEKERPDAGWINEHWIEGLKNIHEDGLRLWGFDHEDNPTVVLHEVYMAYKDEVERNMDLQARLNQPAQVVNTHLQEVELRNLVRQADLINWNTLRPVPAPEELWPALGATEGTTWIEGTIRGPDVT